MLAKLAHGSDEILDRDWSRVDLYTTDQKLSKSLITGVRARKLVLAEDQVNNWWAVMMSLARSSTAILIGSQDLELGILPCSSISSKVLLDYDGWVVLYLGLLVRCTRCWSFLLLLNLYSIRRQPWVIVYGEDFLLKMGQKIYVFLEDLTNPLIP